MKKVKIVFFLLIIIALVIGCKPAKEVDPITDSIYWIQPKVR